MSLLRIHIPADWLDGGPETELSWCRLGSRGERLDAGAAPLSRLPRAPACEIVVAAELVLLAWARLPRGWKRQAPGLLAYAVEDRLLADPETVHVAAGATREDGQTTLAVIDRTWLGGVLARLAGAGLQPAHAWPETLLPALPPAGWIVVWSGRTGFLRTGAQAGQMLDDGDDRTPPTALTLAVEAARAAPGEPDRLVVRAAGGAALPEIEAWSQALGVPVEAGEAWRPACQPVGREGAIDLLQGGFAPSALSRRDWRALRLPLILAGLIAFVHAGASVVEWGMLRHERQQLRAAMERDFRAAFPDARVVVDAPLQMRRNLAELRQAGGQASPADALPLLARAAQALDESERRELRGLRYEARQLTFEFAPGASIDESRLQRFRDAGLNVRLQRTDDAVRLLVPGEEPQP